MWNDWEGMKRLEGEFFGGFEPLSLIESRPTKHV